MAKTREQKKIAIEKLENSLKGIKSLVFVDYYGLKVKEINELRKLLKSKSAGYLVAKKNLLKIALKRQGLENINLDKLSGGVGLVIGTKEEIEPMKAAMEFAKSHEKMRIQGGIFEKEYIDDKTVRDLAKLPSKNELRTQLVSLIGGSLRNFVYVLNGNLNGLVRVLASIKKSS
jgi:large subunit ribosomal protein L10